jgi:hypothetical protein
VLFGLALAVVAVFPRELRRLLTLTNIGIATAGIIVGALPLIAYNIVKPLDTFRSNGGAEPQLVLAKTEFLQHTMDGDILFGFINAKQPGPNPEEAHRWFQSLSISASRWTGHPHHNLTVWAFVACVIALPLLWRTARKPLLFGVAVCIGTWVFIAVTASTGANAHHPILLWPFHFLVIAAALSRLRLFPAAAATALLCGSNLLATNQLYADLIHNGPAPRWTDAMDPLESYLQSLNGVQIIAADWGFAETMNLLSEGQLPMYFADTSGEGAILAAIGEPHNIFVAFARPISFHPEVLAAIQAVARRENYSQERLTTIHDRSGRPTFDVFRYRKLP